MGKRSNFERNPRDFYETPIEAVKPLIPHLEDCYSYCEPCAGNGALVEAIDELAGIPASLTCDIHRGKFPIDVLRDATKYDFSDIEDDTPDHFITNPPWDRKILHPIIENLCGVLPTWLLFDADWMHTKQSAPYMKWCVKIVSVGRVKWIPDSKMTGKDNCCWYLFDKNHKGPTEFYGR